MARPAIASRTGLESTSRLTITEACTVSLGSVLRQGVLRSDIDPNAMIDLLYAPLYHRLQMGTGPLSDSYVDDISEHGLKELEA